MAPDLRKSYWWTPDVFSWKHVSRHMCADFFFPCKLWHIKKVYVSPLSLSLLQPLAVSSHPSLPGACGGKHGSHAEKHKANNTNTLITVLSVTTELPLTHCADTGPPMEMVLFDEAGETGKDSKQRGLHNPWTTGGWYLQAPLLITVTGFASCSNAWIVIWS